jgi:hypothetical protein
VCNPRKNALLKHGNKSDRIDARKLAELLRGNHLKSVYHGATGVRTLRELARSYLTTTKDQTRVMSRLKPCEYQDGHHAHETGQPTDPQPSQSPHKYLAEKERWK